MSDPLDYSPHMIKVRQGLHRMRAMLLKNQYDEAIKEVDTVIVEMRMARAAVKDLKDHAR